ncbi:ribonuclease HI family protein [Methanomassiliicoccus luminyensis]|jgi:ribonuclease HI|uniref:ribonuclease HI family protein n=1 Tax=Methanomassiliicoccus luminyensis TaxID=1080712 RepID=UPI00037590F0|nr:ribonuclease HI family protein [Methanomassiliicoccus luminyensis]
MKLIIYTDGGARGNPGPSAFAVVVTDESGKVIKEFARYAGKITNNEAEYNGAIAGLNEAKVLGADEVEMVMDSELVVKHVNGQYACKASNLRPKLEEVRRLMAGFRKATFRHVPRENKMVSRADALLNQELDVMSSLTPRGVPNK